MHAAVFPGEQVSPPVLWRTGLAAVLLGVHFLVLYQLSQMRLQHSESPPPQPVFVRFIEPAPVTPAVVPSPPAPPKPAEPPKQLKPRPVAKPIPPPAAAPRPLPAPEPAPAVEPPATPAPRVPSMPAQAVEAAPPPQALPPSGPREVSALAYARKPEPEYPRLSRRLGEQGAVVIRVEVDEHGQPRRARITRSSGFARLDEAALQAVRSAVFEAYIEDGRALAAVGLVTIEFKLEN